MRAVWAQENGIVSIWRDLPDPRAHAGDPRRTASVNIEVPKGARLDCVAYFDNSKANFSNPDPTRMVTWGEQTWEEMMIGFVDYTYLDTPAVTGKK